MSVEDQQAAGISRSLLRLSVGIEHVDDLLYCATRRNKPCAMWPENTG
jgi:cystathionine beta-lyase/cystathionine gamma-synthase